MALGKKFREDRHWQLAEKDDFKRSALLKETGRMQTSFQLRPSATQAIDYSKEESTKDINVHARRQRRQNLSHHVVDVTARLGDMIAIDRENGIVAKRRLTVSMLG